MDAIKFINQQMLDHYFHFSNSASYDPSVTGATVDALGNLSRPTRIGLNVLLFVLHSFQGGLSPKLKLRIDYDVTEDFQELTKPQKLLNLLVLFPHHEVLWDKRDSSSLANPSRKRARSVKIQGLPSSKNRRQGTIVVNPLSNPKTGSQVNRCTSSDPGSMKTLIRSLGASSN
ncbi:hypothetical protein ACH5RR_029435 [Cinchona calisaya]|uniref:Uncharacterized protein n=1 Tax=Cinchona calisaya TaxID=153742 RepID=A0ABD2YT86_9GENT